MSRARRANKLSAGRAFQKEIFREDMRHLLREGKVRVTQEILPNSLLLCSRAETFKPEDNDLWNEPDNKSYPTDVPCFVCHLLVAMSGWMHRKYNALPDRSTVYVICHVCFTEGFTALREKGIKPAWWPKGFALPDFGQERFDG